MPDEAKLYEKLREKIRLCEVRYEEAREDPYLSVVRHSALETIQSFAECLMGGESGGALLEELRRKLPELEQAKRKEEEMPTFDWYDEHYHYKLLEGQCDACRYMIELLQEETGSF